MGVAGYFDDVAIFKEGWRIEAVAELMIVVAVVVIPAVPTNAFWRCGKAPFEFADLSRDIACALCDLCEEDFVGAFLKAGVVDEFGNVFKGHRAFGHGAVEAAPGEGPSARVCVVIAGHEAGARRGAKDAAIGAGELQAFAGEAVDIGGLKVFLAVAGEHAAAEVVAVDVDDVGIGHGYSFYSSVTSMALRRAVAWCAAWMIERLWRACSAVIGDGLPSASALNVAAK